MSMKHTPTPDFWCRHVKFGMQLDRSYAHTQGMEYYSLFDSCKHLTSRATYLAYTKPAHKNLYTGIKLYNNMYVQL